MMEGRNRGQRDVLVSHGLRREAWGGARCTQTW